MKWISAVHMDDGAGLPTSAYVECYFCTSVHARARVCLYIDIVHGYRCYKIQNLYVSCIAIVESMSMTIIIFNIILNMYVLNYYIISASSALTLLGMALEYTVT